MMRKRTAVLLLLLSLAALVTGCWDRRELEETAFVLAVGVDKGEKQPYAVTVIIAIPGKMAGGDKGGGGGEKPFIQTTVEAPTLVGAMGLINSYVDRQVSLLHARALFLHEDLAKKGCLAPLDEFVRFRQSRRTIFFFITREKTATFLKKLDPKMEKDPQRFIEQMTYNYRYNGLMPAASQIQTFVTNVDTGYVEPVAYYASLREEDQEKKKKEDSDEAKKQDASPEKAVEAGNIPREGGPNVDLVGAAAFRKDRMVGKLNGAEMRLVLMLQDQFRQGFFSPKDPQSPEDYLAVELRRARPTRISVDLSGEKPRIRATVALEGELTALQSGIDYTEPDQQKILERHLARNLEEDFEKLIRKTQDWDADVAGFGRYVIRQFATIEEWEKYDWRNRYPDADVKVDVQVKLRRFGLQLSPPRKAK